MTVHELIDVERLTPYGFKLQDGTYRKATETVRKFTSKSLPGQIKIVEENKKEGITKVNIQGGGSSDFTSAAQTFTTPLATEKDRLIVRQNALAHATDLVVADKIDLKQIFEWAAGFESWVFRTKEDEAAE